MRRVVNQVEIPSYCRGSAVGSQMVLEEGCTNTADVGTRRVVVDFGDGGNVAGELHVAGSLSMEAIEVSTHRDRPQNASFSLN